MSLMISGLEPRPHGLIYLSDYESDGALIFQASGGVNQLRWASWWPEPLQEVSTWDTWHNVTIVRDGYDENSQVVFDGTTYQVSATPDNKGQILLGVRLATREYFDNVRVRKWAGFDPQTTVGISEESGNFRAWIGSVDTDWNDGDNWTGGSTPDASTNVIIPDGTPVPHVNISNAVCNNLTIDPTTGLVINAGQSLTINGALSNNGTFTIKSTGLNSSGSLIVNGTSSGFCDL